MYFLRRLSVTHSRKLEVVYQIFEPLLVRLHRLWDKIGYERVEKPIRIVEKSVKSLMFDCQMCGQCALSSTGMSCPMNCPKSIRNGPCGGVRMNGNCEVNADMRCVWMEAWRGSQQMQQSENIFKIQQPVNYSYKGTSSWLRLVKDVVTNKKQRSPDVRVER
jgi:hypothetical protein